MTTFRSQIRMMSDILLTLTDVIAGEMNHRVLSIPHWQIKTGQHWVITGPNGVGKTMLAKVLSGKARIFSGHLSRGKHRMINDTDGTNTHISFVSFTDTSKLFRSVNADHYYQQRYNAFDSDGHLTVRGYLLDGGLNDSNIEHKRLIEWLKLGRILDRERIKLSSGQTRKLLLCKALLKAPKILLLDDPHIGLDGDSRNVLNDQLDQLVEETGTTLILSGHFTTLPRSITHEIQLSKGTIESQHKVTTYLSTQSIQVSAGLPSPSLTQYYQETFDPEKFDSVISLNNVGVKYGNEEIIHDFSWQVLQGEKWSITGSNGAGKSTLLSLIYGDHPQAYANNIHLFGQKRGGGESIWDIKRRIGFSSAELHAYFRYDFPADEIVLSGLWDGYFVKTPSPASVELLHQLIAYYDLTDQLSAPFHILSTGTQRILFFLRSLIKAPSLLLLDEPFQGMDLNNIERSKSLLDHILPTLGTLIFISHYPEEIPAIVEKQLVLQ
ncbi:MAG: ATP-binding cassette domain-containing protein [Saprospiraceae bacterium]|nr:ATP-binding cassette domain-containing protein [Saprospiraceae bacterium]